MVCTSSCLREQVGADITASPSDLISFWAAQRNSKRLVPVVLAHGSLWHALQKTPSLLGLNAKLSLNTAPHQQAWSNR